MPAEDADTPPRLQVDLADHGFDSLFSHGPAHSGVGDFQRAGLVGSHPLYLVGMEVPGHRGGPAVAALLILADGRLLAATSRPWKGKKDLNDLFPYDTYGLEPDELRTYSKTWLTALGGFPAVVFDSISDYDAARNTLRTWASSAGSLAHAIAHDLADEDRQLRLPWDHPATAVCSLAGVTCAVFGLTPDLDDVEALDVPPDVKRAMTLPPPPPTSRLTVWAHDIAEQVHPTIPSLLDEAWAIRFSSPRASVVVSRTAAERVIESLGVDLKGCRTLNERIQKVQSDWVTATETGMGADRTRLLAWRSDVIACLDTVREVGNLVHQAEPVRASDAIWCRSVLERLIESVLGRGVLQSRPTH